MKKIRTLTPDSLTPIIEELQSLAGRRTSINVIREGESLERRAGANSLGEEVTPVVAPAEIPKQWCVKTAPGLSGNLLLLLDRG